MISYKYYIRMPACNFFSCVIAFDIQLRNYCHFSIKAMHVQFQKLDENKYDVIDSLQISCLAIKITKDWWCAINIFVTSIYCIIRIRSCRYSVSLFDRPLYRTTWPSVKQDACELLGPYSSVLHEHIIASVWPSIPL